MRERRKSRRFPMQLSLRLAFEEKRLSGETNDISQDGISVSTENRLEVGELGYATFEIDQTHHVHCLARVARKNKNASVGLTFAEPSRRVIHEIKVKLNHALSRAFDEAFELGHMAQQGEDQYLMEVQRRNHKTVSNLQEMLEQLDRLS